MPPRLFVAIMSLKIGCGENTAITAPFAIHFPLAKRSTLLLLAAAIALALIAGEAARAADVKYLVDGKPVSEQVYRANKLTNEGLMLEQSRQYAEAAARFKQALELESDLATAHHGLGRIKGKLGDSAQAIEHLKSAMSLDPTLAPAWLTLAGIYQSTGRLAEAISTYREFLSRFPRRQEATRVRSLIQLLEKQMNRQASLGKADSEDDYYKAAVQGGLKRWPFKRQPLKVYIASGKGVKGYKPAFAQILNDSFQEWSQASEQKLRFVAVDDVAQADIECLWTSDRGKLRNQAEGAETLKYVDGNGNISKAKVTLSTLSLSSAAPRTINEMKQMCLHEIGHVLGISGHSTVPSDVMFYSVSFADMPRSLSARDRQTLLRLYANGSEPSNAGAGPP